MSAISNSLTSSRAHCLASVSLPQALNACAFASALAIAERSMIALPLSRPPEAITHRSTPYSMNA